MDVIRATGSRKGDMEKLYPLSSAQQSIWLDQIASPHSTQYNIGPLFVIDGPLDVLLWERAIVHVANCHDALRIELHEHSGVPLQSVRACAGVTLKQLDCSGDRDADAHARAYLGKVFNT